MTFLAQIADTGSTNTIVVIAAAVIALGVLAFGWRDVSRFRFRRVRAIAGVCFTESIRRRVLWITPLAIIGVIAVTQLTRPLDAQDAIRQTTKYCLFATAIIVVVAGLLLACTNLPKEIESRVIFTIVTKPTTRLEIVLGKVLGFSLVIGTILLIMGAFTFGYLQVRAMSMEGQIKSALADESLGSSERARLQRYADRGLLGTKAVRWPDDVQVYAKEPTPDGTRWFGGPQLFMVTPIVLTQADKDAIIGAIKANGSPMLITTLKIDRKSIITQSDLDLLNSGEHPSGMENTFGPLLPTTGPVVPVPQISVSARAAATNKLLAAEGEATDSSKPNEQKPGDLAASKRFGPTPDRGWVLGGSRTFVIPLTSVEAVEELLDAGQINLEVTGITPTMLYGAGPSPVSFVVLDSSGKPVVQVLSSETETTSQRALADEIRPEPPGTRFYSRFGRTGMQLEGRPPEEGLGSVGFYSFRGAGDANVVDGKVTLQTKISVDRAGDLDADKYKASMASITVRNRKTGFSSEPILIEPEANRLVDVRVPVEAVTGGDFDVSIHGVTPGQFLAIHGLTASVPSVSLVRADQSFAFNLLKSLLVLWMLSALVITISVFCSTFLSWPIAVVLTMLLLLGRWGVEQLGESLNPGASRTVANDLFKLRDASKNKAVTDSLEALSSVLRNVGPVLPDVNRFPVIEDIDRGVSIPADKVLRALLELLIYGVPLVLLTYLILRNKEVAP